MITPSRFSLFHRSGRQGFALISTLAILVIVTILVIAYAATMRTERVASQNFTERDRAEAVGMGMLNRLLADHATPMVGNPAVALKPFALDTANPSSPSGLPDQISATNYYAATANSPQTGAVIPVPTSTQRSTLQPIYRMKPDDEAVLNTTGLVRSSKPTTGAGTNAYNADFWAYDGLTAQVLTTAGATNTTIAQPKTVPQWVDYYETDPTTGTKKAYPTAKVAFAVWDEGGKLDINMAGPDTVINGIAPHDLKLETELTLNGNGTALLAYLNNNDSGSNSVRDRNNFSLRKVVSTVNPVGAVTGGDVDTGDDRWLFSMRELVERKLIDPTKINQITTLSRDFDARPEWDGDRAPLAIRIKQQQGNGGAVPTLGAEDFQRSYINNPSLYGMFYNTAASGIGPFLVFNNINNNLLGGRMPTTGLSPDPSSSPTVKADWMQVMRLLAVLRRALPPYDASTGILTGQNAPDQWSANDWSLHTNNWLATEVWGIATNIIQASDAASDYNLTAFNPNSFGANSYQDPRTMVGIRISPLIVETAIKVKKVTDPDPDVVYEVTNYVKIWNPYPFEMKSNGQDINYRVSLWSGQSWPTAVSGAMGNISATGSPNNITAPLPGQFKVIQAGPPRRIKKTEMAKQTKPLDTNGDLEIRMRPYIQDMNYAFSPNIENQYACIEMAGYNNSPSANQPVNGSRDGDATLLWAYFNKSELPTTTNGVAWYSCQIDDPRMGSVRRNSLARETTGGAGTIYPPLTDDTQRWSWIGYHNKHALYGSGAAGNDVYDQSGAVIQDPDIKKDSSYNGKSFTVNGKAVDGYNANFGTNWPGADKTAGVTDAPTFAKMMGTFALPGRPFLNIGEIGGVFAFRPWVTLNFADSIVPSVWGTPSPTLAPPTTNKASFRPAALLDYFTTIGTPKDTRDLAYLTAPLTDRGNATNPPPPLGSYTGQNLTSRYQEKAWLFESVNGTAGPTETAQGNLRPIRGRINLNTAGSDTLTTLLKAPYRMPPSVGLQLLGTSNTPNVTVARVDKQGMTTTATVSDYLVTIDPADAKLMAQAITLPITDPKAIRPLRTLSDLSQLYDQNYNSLMTNLYKKYPQTVITAMIGRLAQFGTVREQAYTIDMVVRTLNPAVEQRRVASPSIASVTTGEARIQARISFDTFTRKAFIESLQYH